MSPNAQRQAFAKVFNWTIVQDEPDSPTLVVWDKNDCQYESDPLNDLNIVHEAEEFVKDWWAYSDHLNEVTETKAAHQRDLIHATASQKVEALLKTHNIWNDSQ